MIPQSIIMTSEWHDISVYIYILKSMVLAVHRQLKKLKVCLDGRGKVGRDLEGYKFLCLDTKFGEGFKRKGLVSLILLIKKSLHKWNDSEGKWICPSSPFLSLLKRQGKIFLSFPPFPSLSFPSLPVPFFSFPSKVLIQT